MHGCEDSDTSVTVASRYPLGDTFVTGASGYPLSAVMDLLSSSLCKQTVGAVIMDIVENILDFSVSKDDPRLMEVDEDRLEVGDVIVVDESGR